MAETNMERNLISEEDLEKAAGGLKISSSTLKKGLIAAGVLATAGATAAGGYYIYNKKKGGSDAPVVAPASPTSPVAAGPGAGAGPLIKLDTTDDKILDEAMK